MTPTITRIRLTAEAKQWLNRIIAPVNPKAIPFLDAVAAMLVASMREGLETKPPQDRPKP